MTSSPSRTARRVAAGLAALAAALPLAATAQAQPDPGALAGVLKPPAGSRLVLAAHGAGVQIYSCNGSAWTFVAPRANLTDIFGRVVVTHFGGPTWQSVKDGSQVVGKTTKSATVDPNAIPWLQLTAASHTGSGQLSGVTTIQRLLTTGGLAPAAATCTTANAGTRAEVPYTAGYVFWR
jgi:hypothetical protein